jgi:hypothetical protein
MAAAAGVEATVRVGAAEMTPDVVFEAVAPTLSVTRIV